MLYNDGTYSFILPAIPYLRIPVNSSDCQTNKPTTPPHQHNTISTTPSPNDKRESTHTDTDTDGHTRTHACTLAHVIRMHARTHTHTHTHTITYMTQNFMHFATKNT